MSEESAAVQTVKKLWQAFNERDWPAAAAILHEDFVCEWWQSRERIRGRANFIAINRYYPGQWTIRLLQVIDAGDKVVSEVEVALVSPEGVTQYDRAVSFFTLYAGKIITLQEYWPAPYPAPDWRRQWVEPF